MKCPECEKTKLESSVYPQGGSSTLMYCAPWYDKKGRYHIHDMNVTIMYYRCSNGHEWNETSPRICPTCGEETHWKRE